MSNEIEGLEELQKMLEVMASGGKVEEAMGTVCAIVERSAKQKAPKGATGNLKSSIASEVETEEKSIKGVVYSNSNYAPYVEYGTGLFAEKGGRKDAWTYQAEDGEFYTTKGQTPQPFMRPALAENKEKIKETIREALKND